MSGCDCHVHVFDPRRFPYAAQRSYTPPPAPVAGLLALQSGLGLGRVVVVQASPYGSDNRCLLDALQALGTERARGVAVLDLAATDAAQIDALHAAGVRGIRLNLQVGGEGAEAARRQLPQARRILQRHGWALHVHAPAALHRQLLQDYQRLQHPVVLDHYAGGLADAALPAAARGAPLYLKLSAPYHLMGGLAELAAAFHAAAPRQLLWGSDWPHTARGRRGGPDAAVEEFLAVDDRAVLQASLQALPDDSARERVLVHNPAALYGFAPT